MKKRLTCLALVLVMLAGLILTGCGKKTDDQVKDKITAEASAEATTLSFYLMSEVKVSKETEKRIEDALNVITEENFKTRLDLRFYTEDEYYTALDAAIKARNEARANGTYSATVKKKADNSALIQFPTLSDYQVDIFYVGGKARFQSYKGAGELANLSSSVDNASKQLRETLASQYFGTLTRLNKNIYAIPSNQAIGEYTYLLLNKKALAATYMSANTFTSLTDASCQDLLSQIRESTTLSEKFVPIWTNVEDKIDLIPNLQTIGVDANSAYADVFSLIGGYVNEKSDQSVMVNDLTADANFMSAWKTLKGYELDGYFATAEDLAAGREFAVGVVKGGAEIQEFYGDDYEMVVLEKPRLSADELYSNLMCVSQYTTNVERCMEIVTYLNTNEEFRNMLLYGIEGADYHLIDTGVKKNEFGETYKVVQRVTGTDYVMSAEKTGNTFITYPMQKEDTVYAFAEYGIAQNKDVQAAMDLNFSIAYEGSIFVNRTWMMESQALSTEIFAAYQAITSMADYAAFETMVKEKLAASTSYQSLLNLTTSAENAHSCSGVCGSLKCYYVAKAAS